MEDNLLWRELIKYIPLNKQYLLAYEDSRLLACNIIESILTDEEYALFKDGVMYQVNPNLSELQTSRAVLSASWQIRAKAIIEMKNFLLQNPSFFTEKA